MIAEIKNSNWINVRFFMKSKEMDGNEGKIDLICNKLKNFDVGEKPIIAPSQVHDTEIIIANKNNSLNYVIPNKIDADGIFLSSNEVEASLRFADCAPVLIYPSDEWVSKNFPWALLLHSGFKGTVLNIIKKGIEIILKIAGYESLKNSYAWVGPCIAKENYPRDFDEWTKKGIKAFHSGNFLELNNKFYFDIKNELKNQLLDSEINEQNIFISDINTFNNSSCYSYRKGDKKDRMFLHVKLK